MRVSTWASGNNFVYELVDGTGAPVNQLGITVTEIVEGVFGDGSPYYATESQDTGSVPWAGPGAIVDFVGTTNPGLLPNVSGNGTLTTTQNWVATWQGQTIGLTTVNNQQIVSAFGSTFSCVTPVHP